MLALLDLKARSRSSQEHHSVLTVCITSEDLGTPLSAFASCVIVLMKRNLRILIEGSSLCLFSVTYNS